MKHLLVVIMIFVRDVLLLMVTKRFADAYVAIKISELTHAKCKILSSGVVEHLFLVVDTVAFINRFQQIILQTYHRPIVRMGVHEHFPDHGGSSGPESITLSWIPQVVERRRRDRISTWERAIVRLDSSRSCSFAES